MCFGASSKGLQDGRARFASGARTTAQQRGEGWAVLRQRAAGRARHNSCMCRRWRPYRVEHTGSLLTSEVKRHRARLVLGWGTAREDLRVLSAFMFHWRRFRIRMEAGTRIGTPPFATATIISTVTAGCLLGACKECSALTLTGCWLLAFSCSMLLLQLLPLFLLLLPLRFCSWFCSPLLLPPPPPPLLLLLVLWLLLQVSAGKHHCVISCVGAISHDDHYGIL